MAAIPQMTCVRCPGDERVEVGSAAVDQPGPGEMRVRTIVSAVCGSDLHHYRTSAAVRNEYGWSQWALGHENTGIVDAVGPGVGYPAVGDRVVVFGIVGCGHCVHCRRGEAMFCADAEHFSRHRHGTNAAYLVAPARNALPLPDDFDFEMGALLSCNVGTAYGALRKTDASGERPLAVFGLGPVGLACVMLGRARGATVIGVDPVRRAPGAGAGLRGAGRAGQFGPRPECAHRRGGRRRRGGGFDRHERSAGGAWRGGGCAADAGDVRGGGRGPRSDDCAQRADHLSRGDAARVVALQAARVGRASWTSCGGGRFRSSR